MLQKHSAAHSQENSKLQSPKSDGRQEHLDSNRKEHISPAQALSLVQDAKKITGESLPVIPLPDGSKVQIVPLSNGKFFLCHTTQDGNFPTEYNFNKNGVYENARTSPLDYNQEKEHRDASQVLLKEIKDYLTKTKKG